MLSATDYHVGPSQSLASISAVPWATLQAGDRVYIHWRSTPYKEKWVINRQGTQANPIQVIGISNGNGDKPIIDGNGAVTAQGLNYWNESRGVIKIGGSNTPADGLPSYIIIDNLDIRSGRPPYQFTNDNGTLETYSNNAAAIYVEKGEHLIFRNCTLQDCGNGIFIGAYNGQTKDILIEHNYIYDNGIAGRYLEHNTYTEATDIIYQFNRFGPLRTGADGNNLKDRSAGLVVRFNWIEGGNRQLDLVESGTAALINNPSYRSTYVYGNTLIEPDGAGNSQVLHYGGDGGNQNNYRKGNLYFYNNTVISTRSGNTTLMRLSSASETAHVFNNIIYPTAAGNKFAMIAGDGTFNLEYNWLKTGWVSCHCSPTGSVNDLGNNLNGPDPLFVNLGQQQFALQLNSPAVNKGKNVPASHLPAHDLTSQYVMHVNSEIRYPVNAIDMGAFEYGLQACLSETEFIAGGWNNGTPDLMTSAILSDEYDTSVRGNFTSCSCHQNVGQLLTIYPTDTIEVNGTFHVEGQLDVKSGGILIVGK